MLQRAASNAYSWWWASHIRTKQSKWLEQNLQDMEEKVQDVLKLIEEDGDSFAKRAEMYYKKRPELISFVEESYRAYRSLAERYDHISTELQNANNTIASVFPEQVQFSMDEEDESASNRRPKKASAAMTTTNVPMAPKGPMKDLKRVVTMEKPGKSLIRKKTMKKAIGGGFTANVAKSGLSKPEALEEIDKLQKHILALQTEKEFVKSSYENGVAKYWEIENQIKEMQERVSSLQDEFGEGMVIEDGEARNLMAEAALKSCQEKLASLQEKQERSTEEAILESQRIKDVRDKLECLKAENEEHDEKTQDDELKGADREVVSSEKERKELESLSEKIKQQFEVKSSSPSSFTVTQMVEKIDELVNKVISLETAVSSQAALVERLKSETDELQAQVRSLEVDKAALIADGKSNLSNKLKEMNQKLDGIQVLNKSFKDQNNNLQMHFTEANCNLDHLSDKLQCVKSDEEEIGTAGLSETGLGFNGGLDLMTQLEAQPDIVNPFVDYPNNTNPFEDFGIVDSEAKAVLDTFDFDRPQDFSQNLVDVDHKQAHQTVDSEATAELGTFDFDQRQDFSQNMVDLDRKKTHSTVDSEETAVVSTFDFDQKQDLAQNPVDVDRKQTPPITDSEATTVLDTSDFDPRQKFSQKQVDVDHKPQDFSPEPVDVTHEQTPPQHLVDAQPREDGPNWQKLFTDGMDNREKVLLTEYTSTLRNYKDVKKRLGEAEKKNQDSFYDTVQKLKAMKSMNVKKDEEIRTLRLKLGLLEDSLNAENNEEEDIDVILSDKEPTMSATEEKFRTGIDELLEQNLNFWLRFSSIFHQIQKFDTEVDDLKSEIKRLEEKRNSDQDKSNSLMNLFKSDARPLYKHLREIQTELAVWLEKSALLKEELQCRFSSLCDIQEEITLALKASAEGEDFKFTSYQAAKFQGEVLNMKQENNKVADELQAGLDHVTAMQIDIERTLVRLNEEFQLSGGSKKRTTKNKDGQGDHNSRNDDQNRFRETMNRARIPLRSFIFGVRSKKQKPSIFASVAPSMTKKYQGLKSGLIFRVGE